MDKLRSTLQEVFRDVFEDDALEFRDDLTAADVEQWDSIRHVNMIIAVEHALGIRFATAEVARLKQPGQTAGSIVRMAQEKLAAK
jgi:acyl carrier protein